MNFEFLQSLNLIWPIIVGILGAIIYKVIPFFQTKIQEHRYYNIDLVFILIEYELIGTGIATFLAIFLSIIVGKSTWESIYLMEYGIALMSIIMIYVIGIIVIIKLKTESGLKNYFTNIIIAVLIYIFLLIPFYMKVIDKKNLASDLFCILGGITLIFVQIMANVKSERVKRLEYYVLTADEDYALLYKPIKYGKYFYLRIHNENKKEVKRIQIHEDKVVRIEYIIHEISKSDEEKLQDPLIGDVELENGTENCERIKSESNDKIEKEE